MLFVPFTTVKRRKTTTMISYSPAFLKLDLQQRNTFIFLLELNPVEKGGFNEKVIVVSAIYLLIHLKDIQGYRDI